LSASHIFAIIIGINPPGIRIGMMTGGRRLQTGGTNNSLGLAKIFVGLLKLHGVDNETIVDE